ncbi:MAG: antirepressor [Candidatus Magasanikbacteria bacterium RIFCSPHIGHO2_01_FULL_41_23]|uniref:Antirepressor n=1 Tax=Candidatus Magasanikbacteria bacterium RIFCSPLOWO2_01_FULL_40_15 TaxID=1798686 RepID=A0A1F6N3N0_9BACT|nr:MAG: antirepressor [Candidatus Magasanikbacteria bacterium RIFCSPHIGHO2_01_FULL_41_23]OGH66990.1 MAG: antirepressor [Candidatus Magasanikbacteria bacterium RIFCSPHIGHO2_02_FULL_41_35]OGH74971.1 MAG: antirepressor [Candidatus Magasanikbacteria bacterium RIFCSPHIGHO2_12_FULL_41_16]OGH78273.1 MAG: antirepressor [Candidatus Magasanikbacteria bacterium RIFCSPLOWO2_01_FULL_40_15]
METKNTKVALFEGKQIRRLWDDSRELWYFSVVDVIQILTEQLDFQLARNYWKVLKNRLRGEGSQTVTKCNQLKMIAQDGKSRLTDAADTETILRIIQSIPSPKAEPFKLWLAQVGYERLEEIADPELSINRALRIYAQKGYGSEWINQRLKSIEVRKDLTNEWEKRGIKEGFQFAILTDEITKAWTGIKTKNYKKLKGLTKENLRDNMTNLELVLNMLAETATTEISKTKNPETFQENKEVARTGGKIAGDARKSIENKTGKKVITPNNDKNLLNI